MTIRNVVLGLTMVAGLSFWAWCRPGGSQAQARDLTVVHSADEPGIGTGGNHDDAVARFRTNQSQHWRQVALGKR